MKKLNLGCGVDTRKGFVNLDIIKHPGVDVVHDLNNLPLPFESNSFDYILCNAILEHLPNMIYVMEELWRISKPNAIIEIDVPHFSGELAYRDPTHVKFFHSKTFDAWDINNKSRNKTTLGLKMMFDVNSRISFFGKNNMPVTKPINKIKLFY